MHLEFLNVNDAFTTIVGGIADGNIQTVRGPSRVGEVLTIPEPVIFTYQKPEERVLFNAYRDANPFFHLYEAMWMLAGRNDIEPLDYYSSNYSKQVQDGDDPDANGAYGYRWRHAPRTTWIPPSDLSPIADSHCYECGVGEEDVDQLGIIIDHFKHNPNSRRVVLQMWNVVDDLLKIGHYEPCSDCDNGKWQNGPGKAMLAEGADCPICKGQGRLLVDYSVDVACNTNIYFSIRDTSNGLVWGPNGPEGKEGQPTGPTVLDMTVCNRSNDIVWGMLGANYVHFSFLQEYLACALGIETGLYHQFSNNAHVYTDRFKPEEWLRQPLTMWDPPNDDHLIYSRTNRTKIPLVQDREVFDKEVMKFVEMNKNGEYVTGYTDYAEQFLSRVAQPLMHAFHMHKQRDYSAAFRWLEHVAADDWRIAGMNWIKKRHHNWEHKQEGKE